MTHHFSILRFTTIPAQKVGDGAYFSGAHGASSLVSTFQAQIACNAGRLRLSSVRLAITRLLNAQAMSIFIKPAISHLRESKLTFDDAELVLHFGSDSRLVPVFGSFFIGQLPVAAALRLREIFSSWRMVRDSLCLPAVRGVTPDSGFLAVEQVGQYLGIMNIGRCGDNGVDELY